MARYTIVFLIFPLFLLTGCPPKESSFSVDIHNNCAEPAVLYFSEGGKGKKLEIDGVYTFGFLLRAKSIFGISNEEYIERVTRSLDTGTPYTVEFANGKKYILRVLAL